MSEDHEIDEDQSAADLGTDDWRRLHPLSPLLRGGLFVLVLLGIIVANLRDRIIGLFISDEFTDGSGDIGDLLAYLAAQGLLILFFLAIVAAVLLIVFFSWLAWRFRTFRVTAEAVEERSGIVFRQHRRAPLERIQSVNLQRPLLARVLGLTEVSVQTAGQGGKVALRYLSHAHAKELREQILRIREIARDEHVEHAERPSGLPEALEARANEFVDADISPEAERTASIVRVPVGRLLGSILLSWDLLIPMALTIAGLVSGILWHPGGFAIVVPGALMFFGIGFGQFNRGFAFTLSRSSDGIRVGAGLTATNTETVPLRRIHAIEARQPLGWRPFGWWKVRITTAGHSLSQGGQNRLQNVVLPVGLESDVLRVFETLEFTRIPNRESLIDELSGSGTGYLGAGHRAGWVLWFGRRRAGLWFAGATGEPAAPEAAAAGAAEAAVPAAESGVVTESLRIRRGALTRSLSVMPIVRAQSIQLHRPLLHRLLGLATLQAHTVLGPVRMEMRGIGLTRARALFDRLAETVVRVQAADSDSARGAVGDRERATP